MKTSALLLLFLFALGAIPSIAVGQSNPSTPRADGAPDSLLSYDLAEIVVESGTERRTASTHTVQRVRLNEIARENASDISDLSRLIPAAHAPTNSRGETLIYMRNAGERQVALFFNGALLNVPWDNRIDVSMLPAPVIGSMTISKGVPSVMYGTNVIGGAINITAQVLNQDGFHTELQSQLGSAETGEFHLSHLGRKGGWGYMASVGYASRDGLPLSGDADLPYSQDASDLRLNTDRTLFNAYVQGQYSFEGGAEVGLSVLHYDGEKGVAPESHIDPAVSSPRYWRYPYLGNTLAILNGSLPLPGDGLIRGAVWGGRFGQEIEQYTSQAYAQVESMQEDEDRTAGLRVTWTQPIGSSRLNLALNGLSATHDQVDTAFDENGAVVLPEGETAVPTATYRQQLYSVGAEYALFPVRNLELTLGGSVDGIATPETGDKPPRDPMADFGYAVGARYGLTDAWSLRGAFGRKVRFATMRELFGEALNRFLLNPDLRPETSLATEVGIERMGPNVSGELVLFHARTFDTIDQRRVDVDGRTLRQRINLEGSRVYGFEAVGRGRLHTFWTLDGHLTWMHARGLLGGETQKLTEKPEWIGTVSLVHNNPTGLSFTLQTSYTGRAYGLNEDNARVALPTSLVVNARLAFRWYQTFSLPVASELFLRVDNLTDDLVMPQLGLPSYGRMFRAGVTLAL